MSHTNHHKRVLSTTDASDNKSEPVLKRRKLNERDAVDFTSRLHDISQDDRINDVEFTINQTDSEIEIICGIKAFFAAHSDVFKSMLYNKHMKESQTNKVVIDDVTVTAFKFIKDYTHFANPDLKYEHVIDILYAAEKYMMTNIIEKCTKTIHSMQNVDQFFLVTTAINKYSQNVFDELFTNILATFFARLNVLGILTDKRSEALNISQIQRLIMVIHDDYDRYVSIKKYCKSVSTEWKTIFNKHFKDFVNFVGLSVNELINEVAVDEILEQQTLLRAIEAKVKKMKKETYKRINQLEVENKTLSMTKKKVLTQNRTLRAENKKLKSRSVFSDISESDSSSSD